MLPPEANVVKLFSVVIYHHPMVIQSFRVINYINLEITINCCCILIFNPRKSSVKITVVIDPGIVFQHCPLASLYRLIY